MSKYVITGASNHPQHDHTGDRLDVVEEAVLWLAEGEAQRQRAAAKDKLVESLRDTVKPKGEPEPAPRGAATPSSRPRISYWRDGKRWNERSGAWVEVNPRSWDSPTFRNNLGRVLQVGEPGLPTVVNDNIGPVVRSGCVLCGLGEVVQDIIRLGRKGGVRGGFCVDHHIAWHKRPLDQPHGLWVTEQLDRAGRLPDDYPRAEGGWIEHYPQRWGKLCWGIRVLRSSDPAAQLPMAHPFGFLNPGPAFRLHDDDREKVST